MDKQTALKRMQRYCAFQERCHSEVRTKLLNINVYGDMLEEIIADLVSDNYLNEERFAKAYAGGKFRIKNWGRTRIYQELVRRQISEYCINRAMQEIDDDAYIASLRRILNAQNEKLGNIDLPLKVKNLTGFGIKKGYEMDLVIEEVRKIVF